MAQPEHTPEFVLLEEAITVLFCLIDDAYTHHPQPQRSGLRASQKDFGLGGRNACCPLPTAAGHRGPALLLARGRPVVLAPVPGGAGHPSFVVPSQGWRARALPGAFEALCVGRVGRRA